MTAYWWFEFTDRSGCRQIGYRKTKAEAMKQVKRQGGDPGKTGYVAYYFGNGLAEDTGWVTDMGYIRWEFDSDETAALPTKDQPQPTKEVVGL